MDSNKLGLHGIKSIFILLVLMIFQSCMTPRDRSIKNWEKHEWKKVKLEESENPTWEIYTKKVTGSDFIEYKIEGEINSSPEIALMSFSQAMQKDSYDSQKYPTYDIMKMSNDTILTYVVHNEPFPLRDTEMSVKYIFHEGDDSSSGVRWKEAWEDCVVKPTWRLKRVETFRGSWLFSPISSHHSKAANSVQFDPKGMPKWLYRPMVFKFLIKGIKDIRDLSTSTQTSP